MIQEMKGRALNGLCHKCGGLLVVERTLDFYGPLPGWKCVNCGWYRRDHQQSRGMGGRAEKQGDLQ